MNILINIIDKAHQSGSNGTPSEAGGDAFNDLNILAIKRRVGSLRLASIRSTHSAFPILTSNNVRIINGKGATWSTCEGMFGNRG